MLLPALYRQQLCNVLCQVVSEIVQLLTWQLCILFQMLTDKVFDCLQASPISRRRVGVCAKITSLVNHFMAIGAAPIEDIELPEDESMQKSHSSRHKSFPQLAMASAL